MTEHNQTGFFISQLRQFLTASSDRASSFQKSFWLGMGLLFSAYFASLALQQAFSSQYVVQDDARQHVFWMQRFIDSELLKEDLIADYFQSIAPLGYMAVYKLAAMAGINPFLLHKLLPMALGLVTTAYCFGVAMQIMKLPAVAFFSTLLLNQSLWMRDALVSGTPRAFSHALLLAFIYYMARGRWLPCLITVALLGLFYPSFMLIAAALLPLRLLGWQGKRLHLSESRKDYIICAAGIAVALLVALLYQIKSSHFAPVITASEASTSPEFLRGGRMAFFHDDPIEFWLTGNHSGMVSSSLVSPPALLLGLLLPVLLYYRNRFPLVQKLTEAVGILPRIIFASVALFFGAHIMLFRLYLPPRFTIHSFRIVMSISAAIVLISVADAILRWSGQQSGSGSSGKKLTAVAPLALFMAAIIFFPAFVDEFPKTRYITGSQPELYEFFLRQPKDSLIASLTSEADNLPSFAARPVLVSRELAIPFHKGYYDQISQRASDLIHAQYTPDLDDLKGFIRKYGVDFFLLDKETFTTEYVERNRWGKTFRAAQSDALTMLKQGANPALARLVDSCKVFDTEDLIVIDAMRIQASEQK
jgi:hypothetical protein